MEPLPIRVEPIRGDRRQNATHVKFLIALLLLATGALLLGFAADQLVVGAARLARLWRISAVVVGVAIVGLGTSTPELLVSAFASASGQTDIAVGNVIGSNVVNLTLLLGVGALIVPLVVMSGTVRREAPLTFLATLVFAIVVRSGPSRAAGALLLFLLAVALTVAFVGARRDRPDALAPEVDDLFDPAHHRVGPEVLRTVLGLAGTLAGAQALLTGAIDLAELAGLSDGFVGVTIVAIGTALPELVTVVQSARRREPDLIVGNLLGSNLINSCAVAGLSFLIRPAEVSDPTLTGVSLVVLLSVTLLAWVFLATKREVSRIEGGILVACYGAALPLFL